MPSAWNIDEGSEVISPALKGSWGGIPPIGADVGGVLRLAAIGVPVAPPARMMIDECLPALGRANARAARTGTQKSTPT
jgi:hypothetical protein